jgi:chromosome segregation protein
MHLKRLTIHGFKSFADKVVLTFDKGITGIVGPNGSGKSNVIDAVRWVMGEQNAKNLRGDKATDIIFAGSDKRKALSIAEVSLTFDNTEDTGICPPEYRHEAEITLTRKLYADNEREYFINRKPCRLKDIVQFFSLTGLGGRSYSMIQQGQVDRILNAKPEDVREILEEAAGTLVFKQRKIEAQKKLEETNLNLSRVEDILREVEKQQQSLESQVEKAKQWTTLSDELRDLEIKLFLHNLFFFKDKLEQAEVSVRDEQDKEVELSGQIASLQSRYEELQQVLADSDPELAHLNEEFTVVREYLVRAESAIATGDSRVQSHLARLASLSTELGEEDSNLKLIEQDFDRSASELQTAESESSRLKALIESFQDEVDGVDESANVYRSKMQEQDDEIRNLQRLLESNRLRHDGVLRELDKSKITEGTLVQKLSVLEAEALEAQSSVAKWEEKASGQQEGLDKEIREKHEREQLLATSYREVKEFSDRREGIREKYHETKARLTSLEELVAGATDAAGSWKTLCQKEKSALDLDVFLLAEKISFKDSSSELPKKLTQSFERWAERLVAKSLEPVSELARLCAKNSIGGFPISVIQQPTSQSDLDKWAEKEGAFSIQDFVSLTPSYSWAKALLSRVFVLQVIHLDESLIKKIPQDAIVFTPQGLVIEGSEDFYIAGSGSQGILSKKVEQDVLQADLKKLEVSLASTQGRLDELESIINTSREFVAAIDSKLQGQNKEVLGILAEVQSARQTAENKTLLANEVKTQLDGLKASVATWTKELDDLYDSRQSLEKEKVQIDQDLQEIRLEYSGIDERRGELQRQNQQRQLDLARADMKAQQLRDQRRLSHAQLELVQNKLSRRYEEQSKLRQEIDEAKLAQTKAEGEIEGLILKRDELQDKISEKRESNSGVHEELKVVDGRLRDLRDALQNYQASSLDKKVEMERLKLGIKSLEAQAQEKYHVTLGELPFVKDEDFVLDKAAKSVTSLRTKIENIGPVNLMAMKEYEELADRSSFITTQRDEIHSSIEVLNTAIQEIELTSKDKFSVIFEVINKNFGELFGILFPGGEAALELTNPEDPLAGGVELMVRLPGKTRKSMSLCSGGEKALTAISLIFALLRTKPTPFCFLDEVDAPLDEANVGRYNRVLEALSEQFQFVVITHNRRTMEVLDTLYGVTMQEGGVSTVLGVDMKKDMPAHLKKAFKDNLKMVPGVEASTVMAGTATH